MNDDPTVHRFRDRPDPAATACPTCRAPVAAAAGTFPFCSDRCKTIDLGRWLDESYRVSRPIEQSDIEEEA
ncbi:MAG: DNA gyrase inhibitor YacG [Planctomycetota bacterium]